MADIKQRRIELGLTQKQIADACGIKQAGYSMIESGARNPSIKTAKRIAEVLRMDWVCFFE